MARNGLIELGAEVHLALASLGNSCSNLLTQNQPLSRKNNVAPTDAWDAPTGLKCAANARAPVDRSEHNDHIVARHTLIWSSMNCNDMDLHYVLLRTRNFTKYRKTFHAAT